MSAKPAITGNKHLTMAEQADIHELYEESVQNVEHEVEFMQTTFKEIRYRTAYLFREDFCGSASVSCQWVRQGEKFKAIGVDIVRRAIEAPIRQIAENAGLDGAVISEEVKKAEGNQGFNALTNEHVDLVEAGVIDPAKVTRSALENAASIAGLLLTTEAIISEIPDDSKEAAPAGGGGMGGMY